MIYVHILTNYAFKEISLLLSFSRSPCEKSHPGSKCHYIYTAKQQYVCFCIRGLKVGDAFETLCPSVMGVVTVSPYLNDLKL